jgi:succinate dehydrogenase / fumarate reductase cytochrome b subunit
MSATDAAPAKRKRPLSPHLQIYRWPLTMATSILHRASGIALVLGSLLLAWWLIAAAAGPGAYRAVEWFAGSWLGILLLMGWTAALFFHFFAGIRHLAWDAGCGFDLKVTTLAGQAVLGATAAATLLVWIAGFLAW